MQFSKWCACLAVLGLAWGALAVGQSAAAEEGGEAHPGAKYSGVVPVEVRREGEGWRLYRGGEPFELKGGGVKPGHFAEFAAMGGNSVRTWGLESAEAVLDEAYEAGVTVMMGIWMTHPKHGYDYGDAVANQAQIDKAVAAVERLKDHPALLFWGVGNEVEIQTPSDERIYQQINRMAKAIKEVDPHHPTVVVTAGTGSDRARLVAEHCPDVDVFGPNIYGKNMLGVVDRIYASAPGLDKPLIFPEWGPTGQWGRKDSTEWGSVLEPSSTDKGIMYLTNWVTTISAERERLLGGYVFYLRYNDKPDDGTNWPTWYSMHHHTGEPFGGVDVMQWAFTGRWPDNLAPEIEHLLSDVAAERVEPGSEHTAEVVARDRNVGDELSYEWVLSADHEARQQIVKPKFRKVDPADWVLSSDGPSVRFRLPDDSLGPYRLHVVVRDGGGKAARANVPLFVGTDAAYRSEALAGLEPEAVDPQARTLLILGDSNAASDRGWVAALAKMRPRYTIINPSIPGATFGFDNLGQERLNTLSLLDQRLPRADLEAAASPSRAIDTVVINLGTKDSKAVFDGRGDEVVEHLREMIRRLRAHYEFVQAGRPLSIVVMSPPPYGPDEMLQGKYHGGAARVEALVPRFRAVCEEMNVAFVDIHTPLKSRLQELSKDGVHYYGPGARLVAERLFAALVAEQAG